ncbi:MAG: VWA domain-containing protein [Lentisphaeria bacterium]|nr:VWA domain-containing protein [Lentisphaeria bacterium]
MSDVRWQDVQWLFLLWGLPLLALVFVYAAQRRRRALGLFVDPVLVERLSRSVSPVRRRWKAALVLSAAALLIVALARPQWNPKPKLVRRQGRDVVFVLDVSRSMLAEDLRPNRLERAKLAIGDCIDVLEGDRVGLVVFAGTAAVICPLTLDYGFFRMMLNQVDTQTVSRGGTMIGDALRKALDEVFDDQQRKYKDIVLITDGEDHDSFPEEAARQVGERGIRLLAVGLGTEGEGEPIPVTGEDGRRALLEYKGERVFSRLDADTLRRMVNVTPGGKYLPVATGTINLDTVYANLIAAAEKREVESQTIRRYEEKYQVFLAAGFLLLCVETALSERRRRP